MARWWVICFAVLCAQICTAQLWNGVLSTARGFDWQDNVGLPGDTLPDSAWTQCGATLPSTSSAATILAAWNHTGTGYTGCGSNTYVKLGAGTFNLSAAIVVQGINNNELRGSGPTQTDLVFTGVSGCAHGLGHGVVCIDSNDGTFPGGVSTTFNVTAGLTQGSTSITVSASTGITANSTLVFMDQLDDTVDNGNFYNCQQAYNPLTNDPASITVSGGVNVTGTGFSSAFGNTISLTIAGVTTAIPWTFISSTSGTLGTSIANGTYNASFPTGCSFNSSVNAGRANRGQEEAFEVTACSPSCNNAGSTVLTITPPIAAPNWTTANSPQIWLVQPSVNVGVRDLKIDASAITNVNTIQWCMEFDADAHFWVYNVAFESCANVTLYNFVSAHGLYLSNYIHRSGDDTAQDTSGFNMFTFNTLVENNICQDCHLPIIINAPGTGNVIAHNYCTNVYTGGADLFNALWTSHSNGSNYNLWEGNMCPSMIGDQAHGETMMLTCFRCFLPGWDSCANGQCGSNTAKTDNLTPVMNLSFDRYWNIIDSVLGTPGIQTLGYQYQNNSYYFSSGTGNGYVYNVGSGSNASPNLSGTVNTQNGPTGGCSANCATSATGNLFQPGFFVGDSITITGSGTFTISSVQSFSVLTLSGAPGPHTGAAWSISGSGNSGGPIPIDPVALSSSMAWLNYDVFHSSIQANSSEVPSGIANYPNPVPTATCTVSLACPASFYLASKPSWWGSLPFPGIGSDITGGNLGIVAGTINTTGHQSGMAAINGTTYVGNLVSTAWAAHANANPAMNCFLNTLGGLPDGTNSAVAFDATVCFSGSNPTTPTAPSRNMLLSSNSESREDAGSK